MRGGIDMSKAKRQRLVPVCVWGILVLLLLAAGPGLAQQDYANRLGQRGPRGVEFVPLGASVIADHLDPALRKWYVPQELRHEYKWQTWESTNYATNRYQRYLSQSAEGEYFYDSFGNFLTRGWIIYDWTEDRPRTSEGSRILRTPQYSRFFNNLLIASDQKGQYAYSVTIGDEIRTTLTPMTFRKTVFNGTQVDFQSDKYSLTALMSRISAPGFNTGPNPAALNNATNLLAGRAEFNVGKQVTLGATFVNARTVRGTLESMSGNPFKGALSTSQLQTQVGTINIRISDDSPGDAGGAILLFNDVEITTMIDDRDTVLVGSEIGFTADNALIGNSIQGGILREGARAADGTEQILLTYRLADNEETEDRIEGLAGIIGDTEIVNNIKRVKFRLILLNDYKVEVTSNQQTNNEGQPVFLTVAEAPGNVRDGSNRKEIVFDYGLPTANQIFGFTVEARDVMGFHVYSEFDVNHQYRQYPNRRLETHKSFSGVVGDESAFAWMANVAKDSYPWYFLAEGFYMDDQYRTDSFIVDGLGNVDYEDPTNSSYDFIDDNDDNDRLPDQKRAFQDPRTNEERGNQSRSSAGFADDAIFPGWDENGDFISDFNQNGNRLQESLFPDYEEPFLRYSADRPEFLFGMDLNNNGWIDRFENDDAPDYPYKKDHKGYNAYLRRFVSPYLQLTAGQTRQSLISDDRKNVTTYGLVAFERDYPGIGRLRIFDMLKKAEDDIQDDLIQWIQASGGTGTMQPIDDPLAARDTWINSAWIGFSRATNYGINFDNKFKYEIVNQSADDSEHKDSARFLGLINKVAYATEVGAFTVQPRLKSEWLKDNTPYSIGRDTREEWTGTADLSVRFAILQRSHVELGFEQTHFADTILDEGDLADGDFTGDFRSTVGAVQLSNVGEWLGYRLHTLLGFSVQRRSFEVTGERRSTETGSLTFATIHASLN